MYKQQTLERLSRCKKALLEHYLVDPFIVFKQFRLGAMAFGIGLGLIITAHLYLFPSVQQELLTFVGLLAGGAGFFIAMMAQIRLLIGRIVRFYYNKD